MNIYEVAAAYDRETDRLWDELCEEHDQYDTDDDEEEEEEE